MYKRLLPAILLILLSGCVDGIGIGVACEAEMQRVRRQHGAPDQQARGLRSEIWLYGRPPSGFYFEFSWGSAGEPCQVVGPVSQSLLDDRELLLNSDATGDAKDAGDRPSFPGGERP
jgi:hypothetical protein